MKKLFIFLAGMAFTAGFGQQFNSFRDVVGDAQPSFQFAPEGTNDECSIETLSNNFENGYGPLTTYQWANDFVVDGGITFSVNQLKFNIILDAGGTVDATDLYFYTDTAGSGPGVEVGYVDFAIPTSVEVVGSLSGFDVVQVTVDFDPVELIGGATYWIGAQIYSDAASNYWEVTSIMDTVEEIWVLDNGTWAPISSILGGDPSDGVFTLSGDCLTLGTSDVNATQMSIYPNPANDVLNVSLKNAEIKNITITNLSGQVVANAKSTNNVNVSALPAGVYVVKVLDNNGKTHISKVVVK